jgi:hypothetical protein
MFQLVAFYFKDHNNNAVLTFNAEWLANHFIAGHSVAKMSVITKAQ